MKINIIFVLFILIPLATAITIEEGVLITTQNATWNFTQETTLDNLTVGSSFVMFENDNLSLVPNSSADISIDSWSSSTSHSFTIESSALSIPYTIDVSGRPGIIYYNNLYHSSPLSVADATTFSYFATSDVTFTIKEEVGGSLVTGTNVTLELIADEGTYILNTTTGSVSEDIALNTYNIRLSADGYANRYYQAVVDDLSESFTIYLLNSSQASNVTITVYDENGEEVSGATVKALRYYVATNTYELEESSVTNDDGFVTMALQLNSEYYKFMVVYDGSTVKTTSPVILTTTSITININLGTTVGVGFERFRTIDYSLLYNDATDNFRLIWNDLADEITNMCLKTYTLSGSGKTLTDTSCSTSSAGTILSSITPVNGTSYLAQAVYTDDDGTYVLDSLTKSFKGGSSQGGLGLLVQFLFTLLLGLVGFWSLAVMVVIVPASLLIGQVIGLNNFPLEILIPLQVAGFILAFMWRGKS